MRTLWMVVLVGVLLAAPLAWAAPKPQSPPADTRSVGELLKAIESPVPFVQAKAAAALGPKGKAVLPKVLKALVSKNAHARRGATVTLAAMGAAAKEAAPKLVKALKDKEPWVRAGAATALAKMGPLPADQAKVLAAAASDPDPWVREITMSSISGGVKDKALLLKAACESISIPHSGWGICRHALNIIKQHYAVDKKMTTAALLKVLADPPQGMWDGGPAAVGLLIKMGQADKAVPVLIKVLGGKDPSTVGRAADRLGQIGAPAKSALPALRKLTNPKLNTRITGPVVKAIAILEGKPAPKKK